MTELELLPKPLVILIAGLFGAIFGSFLNVCITRLPRGESVTHPRSRCPSCLRPIAWYDNVPVVSWLLLRGRCRHCDAKISPQYVLVELATGLLWSASVWYWDASVEALRAAVFATLLLGIAVTDATARTIPAAFTLVGSVLALALQLPKGYAGIHDALAGALVGLGALGIPAVVIGRDRRRVRARVWGSGAVWMGIMIGVFAGWRAAVLALLAWTILGGLTNAVARVWGAGTGRVPLGAVLATAAAIAFVVEVPIATWLATLVRDGP